MKHCAPHLATLRSCLTLVCEFITVVDRVSEMPPAGYQDDFLPWRKVGATEAEVRVVGMSLAEVNKLASLVPAGRVRLVTNFHEVEMVVHAIAGMSCRGQHDGLYRYRPFDLVDDGPGETYIITATLVGERA